MNRDLLKLDSQICFLLYSSSRAMTAIYRPLLAALDLTYPQYLVMLVLWDRRREGFEQAMVSEIGQRLFLDTGTLTPLLKRLERLGYVHRQRSAVDERVVEIRLTDAGKALEEKAISVPNALVCMAGPDAARIGRLREELRWLLPHLQSLPEHTDADRED